MKQLHLYNALTRSVEPFIPTNPHDVKLYCCGPTLSCAPHLGQARTYVYMDVFRRILHHYLGYSVRLVMNIIDLEGAQEYEKEFSEIMNVLNVQPAHFTPRMTESVELTTSVWKRCMIEKFAYFTRNFNIYFHSKAYLEKFGPIFSDKEYGYQSRETALLEEEKWNPNDFIMWNESKKWIDTQGKQHTGVPSRDTACAAMAIFHFQESIDLVLGGVDLQWLHHEKEMALGRVYFKKKDWVRFFVYTGLLEKEGTKMSNTAQNCVTVKEMLAKGYSPMVIRYMFLKMPYMECRSFSEYQFEDAQRAYNRFMINIEKMKFYQTQLEFQNTVEDMQKSWERCDELAQVKGIVEKVLMNNMEISKALDIIEEFVQNCVLRYPKNMSYDWISYCLEYVLYLVDTCFGLMAPASSVIGKDGVYPVFKKFRSGIRDYAWKAQEVSLLEMCDKAKEEVNRIGYNLQDEEDV